MEQVVKAYVKCPARSVDYICKDHHYGIEVPVQESMMLLIPLVHKASKGVYHGDGFHPCGDPKASSLVLRAIVWLLRP
jgi:hypothetical protein